MLDYATFVSSRAPLVEVDGPRVRIDIESERMVALNLAIGVIGASLCIGALMLSKNWIDGIRNGLLALCSIPSIVALIWRRREPLIIQADDDGISGPASTVIPRDRVVSFKSTRLALFWVSQLDVVVMGVTARDLRRVTLCTLRSRQVPMVLDALTRWKGDHVAVPLGEDPPSTWSWPFRIALAVVFLASVTPAAALMRAGWTVDPAASAKAELYFGGGLLTAFVPFSIAYFALGKGRRRPRSPASTARQIAKSVETP